MPVKCKYCKEKIYSMGEIIDELHSLPKEMQELFLRAKPQPMLPHWTWDDSKSDWRKEYAEGNSGK